MSDASDATAGPPKRHWSLAALIASLSMLGPFSIDAYLPAFGAIRHSMAQVSVSVTGVAGPTGGSPHKPVGTVWFGFMVDGQLSSETRRFEGDRAAVRGATVRHALQRLVELLAA